MKVSSRLLQTLLACSLSTLPVTGVLAQATTAATPAIGTPIAGLAPAPQGIAININGRTVEADPAPILQKGSVFVPLRGVLEALGAKVVYDAAASRIDIEQGKERYSLRVGQKYAVSGAKIVTLTAAPFQQNGRAFVPLRSLAEIFGYKVQWLAGARTVAISDKGDVANPPILTATSDHRALLAAAGRFGVNINFHDAAPDDIEKLLDAAKDAGATLIKFRFDWNALEPEKGGAFQWPLYDRVVREARERDLTMVGVLGNSAQWATRLKQSTSPLEWRNSAPISSELPAWDNYVRRVVGRYKNDVQAWQVWENPATYNFRAAGSREYRIVARRAIEAARSSDRSALVLAAEPGGVNLGFVSELQTNGLLPLVNGVALYPLSQWQPGVVAQPEETLLPVSTLMKAPGSKGEEYWVGGLSRLSLETPDLQGAKAEAIFRTKDHDLRRRLALAFTPNAQADYLVRAITLSLASGMNKVFWGALRDEPQYDLVDPVNSLYGGGLLRPDLSARPSLAAYRNLTQLLAGKTYIGTLQAGPRVVVLVFADPKTDESTAVAWALPGSGESKLILNPERNPEVEGALFIATHPDARVLDSAGKEITGAAGALTLTSRPLWITQLAFETARDLRAKLGNVAPSPLRLASSEMTQFPASGLRAVFAPGAEAVEEGLNWRRYLGFRGAAFEFETVGGKSGLKATFSRDVYNPAAGQPYIYFDVANDYMYNARGASVRITLEVKRPAKLEGVFAPQAGFNIQYDSPLGFKSTPWTVVEGGDEWATYTVDIPDAAFANRDGYDFLINTWGSRQDLVFRSLTLRRVETRDARAQDADGASTQ